jgi:hemolysin-activating ACP:hemolysin acyltransferase
MRDSLKTTILDAGQLATKELEFVTVEQNPMVLALGLMLTSKIHRALTVGKFGMLMLPAIASKTLIFIRCEGRFVGYFAFAYLDDDFHNSLLSGSYEALPPAYHDTSPHTWIIDLLVPSWISSQPSCFAELLRCIKDYSKRGSLHLHVDLPQLVCASGRSIRILNPLAPLATVVVE